MKLSTLQGWYRAHAASGDAASAEAAIDVLRETDDSAARDAALEQLLASDAGVASLRVAAVVQSHAAEAGVTLAQADWRERHAARRPRREAPTWAPYALAAGIALFAVGIAEVRDRPVPTLAPVAENTAPPAPVAAPALAPGDVIFNGKLDDEPVAANAPVKSDMLFRDDLGG